nr:isoaspartyl peptidase/L-asparaginase [Ktedonosporobacter rubrisoli]
MPIAIVVHGGAGAIAPERKEITRIGCEEAAAIGWRVLEAGGSALDAVQAAVCALEDNPEYNAGTGSCLTHTGNIEMDAGLMEGHTLQVGAVANIELLKNPILLARKVLESPHVLLVSQGARRFALENGFSLCKFEDLLTERQHNRWKQIHGVDDDEPRYYRRQVGHVQARIEPANPVFEEPEERHGTVGAVAVDIHGHLASATSTGVLLINIRGALATRRWWAAVSMLMSTRLSPVQVMAKILRAC